jgi:signal transduction histidine kinase
MGRGKSNTDGASAATTAEAPLHSASSASRSVADLEAENGELRRHSQYRSLFLSRLAHELRTPLTSILGFSEILLSQEKLTGAQRAFCERIQNSAQQLQAHLNQLSDLAKLESAQTKLRDDKISISETFREVLPTLARSAEKKQIKLLCNVSAESPVLLSDRARLRQIIYNALAFSISRSNEGATVEAKAEASSAGVVIAIVDRGDPLSDPAGVGILNLDDNCSTGELGLAIARQNVELLGGSISARNLEGEVELRIELPSRIVS